MFAARGIGISLAMFLLLYIPLSLLVSHGWQWVRPTFKPASAREAAITLFILRILPFSLSSLFTLVFTLPSFLLLEPRTSDEALGTIPVVLGICWLVVVAVGLFRVFSAQRRTSRALSKWLEGATVMDPTSPVPVFRTGKDAPTLTVAGVRAPKVLISEAALAALTPAELRTALRHELAHVRSHDNLKKMLFRLASFPGMRDLEFAWSEQAELAADDAAVSDFSDALNLAAALIKVSRIAGTQPCPALTTGLLHSSTALRLRVQRLFSWRGNSPAPRSGKWYVAVSGVATVLLFAVTYNTALADIHSFTEWLVR